MRLAALTMMYNEPVWAGIWARHYAAQLGAENCLVLDHGTDDGSLDGMEAMGVRIQRLQRSALDEDARAEVISDCTAALLRRYDAVVHSDADELLVADPARYRTLVEFAAAAPPVARAAGLDLQHLPDEEAALDPARTLGAQRRWVRFSAALCKPALVKAPVRWHPGFHGCDHPSELGGLYMVHLRYADLDAGLQRLARTRAQAFARSDTNPHQRVSDGDFADMMRAIASLPRDTGSLDEEMAPWLARMREGWARGDGQLSLAGDRLWSLPESVRHAL